MDVDASVRTKYRNIVISGLPGAGSTTLGRQIAERLGWKYFSGGEWMRAYAITHHLFDGSQKIHHDQSIINDDIDRQMDYGMREHIATQNSCVYDSWLCGVLAQGAPDVLKVLMVCSDDAVRVDRLANRDQLTISQAKKHIFDREKKNVDKWARMYAKEWQEWVVAPGTVPKDKPTYFWYPEMYDMVVDTFKNSKEEAFQVVWNEVTR